MPHPEVTADCTRGRRQLPQNGTDSEPCFQTRCSLADRILLVNGCFQEERLKLEEMSKSAACFPAMRGFYSLKRHHPA